MRTTSSRHTIHTQTPTAHMSYTRQVRRVRRTHTSAVPFAPSPPPAARERARRSVVRCLCNHSHPENPAAHAQRAPSHTGDAGCSYFERGARRRKRRGTNTVRHQRHPHAHASDGAPPTPRVGGAPGERRGRGVRRTGRTAAARACTTWKRQGRAWMWTAAVAAARPARRPPSARRDCRAEERCRAGAARGRSRPVACPPNASPRYALARGLPLLRASEKRESEHPGAAPPPARIGQQGSAAQLRV